jgi:PAT family beta-lactamase induction signal transducer AmpG
MTQTSEYRGNWQEAVSSFFHPRVITMLFYGFSAGIPILLIFSSLSLWLREAGLKRGAVTFFSLAALGYSFKFVWAPLVDKLPIPVLTSRMGRRRSWILAAQIAVIGAILWMAFTNPAEGQHRLTIMALAAVALGFSSATQDIVIDAYRIESAGSELQAMMASTYIAGYRIGMIVAGAGALFLADYFGTSKELYNYIAWRGAYMIMAGTMLIGVMTTLIISEPDIHQSTRKFSSKDYSSLLLLFGFAVAGFILVFWLSADLASGVKNVLIEMLGNKHLAGFIVALFRLLAALLAAFAIIMLAVLSGLVKREMVHETFFEPVLDFFNRYGMSTAGLLLLLVGLYRISDIVLGVISNVFYQDLGFTKTEIASVVKTFGMFMTILGGFLGGVLSVRYGVIRILFLGALLASATNLLFMLLAHMGHHLPMLYMVISADNLAAGLASAAFVAFLSSLTSVRFTAVQYAVFSSIMTLIPKVFGSYSGTIVDNLGYVSFFLITTLIGVPVLFLVWLAGKYLIGSKEHMDS